MILNTGEAGALYGILDSINWSLSPRKRGPREFRVVEKRPCVYILASQRNGTLYVGVTSDLARRVFEHKEGAIEGFTKDYEVHNLVLYEFHETVNDALTRKKRIKKWRRQRKLDLIEQSNPRWRDLYRDLAS